MSDHPVATSTPRGEDELNTSGEGTERDINTRPSSASSDLTQISTTDISSHGDREDDEEDERYLTPSNVTDTRHLHSRKYVSSGHTSSGSGRSESRELTAKLSDVEVSLEGVTHLKSSSESPPPLPLSPPPALDDTGTINRLIMCLWLMIFPLQRKCLSHQRSGSQHLLRGQWHELEQL